MLGSSLGTVEIRHWRLEVGVFLSTIFLPLH